MPVLKERKLTKEQKQSIVNEYYKLVKKIAFGYSRKSMDPLEDLIQVGLIALLEAAENFSDSKNTLFKTYAVHYISGHIRHYLRDKQNLMKGPRSLQELSYKVNMVSKGLSQKLGREPEPSEISKELEIPVEKINEAKVYERRISVIWIDQLLSEENEDETKKVSRKILEFKNDKEDSELIEDKIILRDAINKLEPLKRKLLELRYFNDMTQIELSNLLGISQMEVCRKLKKAEKELKSMIELRG